MGSHGLGLGEFSFSRPSGTWNCRAFSAIPTGWGYRTTFTEF